MRRIGVEPITSGSEVHYFQNNIIERYKTVIIALDKDATRKSILLLQQLRGAIKAHVKMLEADLKQYKVKQLMEILNNESKGGHVGRS